MLYLFSTCDVIARRSCALSMSGDAEPFRRIVEALFGAHDPNPPLANASWMAFSHDTPSRFKSFPVSPAAIIRRATAEASLKIELAFCKRGIRKNDRGGILREKDPNS
jgi:hypothetical protein